MREFFEIGGVHEFYRLAEDKDIILRLDPYLMLLHYNIIFYINLSKLSPEERSGLLSRLRHKIVYIKKVHSVKTFIEFLKGEGEIKQW